MNQQHFDAIRQMARALVLMEDALTAEIARLKSIQGEQTVKEEKKPETTP